jgi:hypothetical protein
MKHPSEQQWMDFLYEELSPAENLELTTHAEDCPQCAKQLAIWRGTLKTMDDWKVTALPQRRKAFASSTWRWTAAAAALVLTTGFAVGRLSSGKEDSGKMQAAIESSLEQKFKTQLAEAVENTRKQMAFELSARIEEASQKAIAESILTSKKDAENLAATFASLREEDKKALAAALNQMEVQRISDLRAMRSDLETVALNSEQGLRRTQRGLVQLAGFTQTNPVNNQ